MNQSKRRLRYVTMLGLAICLLGALTGCQPFDFYSRPLQSPVPPKLEPPRETSMVTLPDYRVEPPDILQIDVIKMVPKQPYRLDVFDVLFIKALQPLPEYPLYGQYIVDEEGFIDLEWGIYGKINVRGLTLPAAEAMIEAKLKETLQEPDISLQLVRTGGTQQLEGIYLVHPEGTINLGQYGMVHVAGKTMVDTRLAIEKQLEQFYDSPQVGVHVAGYNSAKYYIIFEGTLGEDVISLPITGKETVLDAIGTMGGLRRASSQEMWLSRPAPSDFGCEQILPIDYMAITRGGSSATNYQLMPGDRLFVAEDGNMALNNYVLKATAPISQMLGISALGANTVKGYQILGRNYNRNRRAF